MMTPDSDPSLPLAGRTALVTGASSGIGLATARVLARDGASVVLVARDRGRLEGAAASIASAAAGGAVSVLAADLSTAAGVDAAVSEAIADGRSVDILVNVAGSAPAGTITALSDAAWATAIDLKLLGFIRIIRGLLPMMMDRGFGRIVNIAGNAGRQPLGWQLTGSVVNAGIIALTKAISTEAAARGVTVNCVCPGPTDTGRWLGLKKAYAALEQVDLETAERDLLRLIPDGRVTRPDEVAELVAFLAGPSAGHVVGQSIIIDGGQVLGA